ncbi:uncharacterized protein LOC132700867 [Cylas formicarius]|uniref:uncharacterized protein LOC132700867 n=1 Tax=Cylas formicarius TaxID=197179 RepID=UPI0029583E33|nr:uncharacterized protein LOC132700867 [Cylas formicarius]
MKCYAVAVTGLLFWTSLVNAGQLITGYNLIGPQQLIVPYEPQIVPTFPHHRSVPAHPRALQTSLEESVLPEGLSKSNHFYGNPLIAGALARESLNFNKEAVVYDRPSEKIPRDEIAKLINNLHRVHHGVR